MKDFWAELIKTHGIYVIGFILAFIFYADMHANQEEQHAYLHTLIDRQMESYNNLAETMRSVDKRLQYIETYIMKNHHVIESHD